MLNRGKGCSGAVQKDGGWRCENPQLKRPCNGWTEGLRVGIKSTGGFHLESECGEWSSRGDRRALLTSMAPGELLEVVPSEKKQS